MKTTNHPTQSANTEARPHASQQHEGKQIEAKLMYAQRMEPIGALAGGVAHEINNPIMCIINYAQLILDKLGPDSPLADYAKEIGNEAERVTAVIKKLLLFAQHMKPELSPARISDIVESTLSLVQTVLRHDQIVIQVDVPDHLPIIQCRSQQIQQVLMNLITNARDALNETAIATGKDRRIIVSAHVVDSFMRLMVEDTGPGIPESVRERMFDPFFTTKPRDKGTGLGLSTSIMIVKSHGGDLHAESQLGKWTRFYVDLPIEAVAYPSYNDD